MTRTIALLPHISISIAIGWPLGRSLSRRREAIVRDTPVQRNQPAPLVHHLAVEEPQPTLQATWRLVDGKPAFSWTIVPQTESDLKQE